MISAQNHPQKTIKQKKVGIILLLNFSFWFLVNGYPALSSSMVERKRSASANISDFNSAIRRCEWKGEHLSLRQPSQSNKDMEEKINIVYKRHNDSRIMMRIKSKRQILVERRIFVPEPANPVKQRYRGKKLILYIKYITIAEERCGVDQIKKGEYFGHKFGYPPMRVERRIFVPAIQ